MKLFGLNKSQLSQIGLKPFKLESEIQELVEHNLNTIFDVDFVKSEFRIKNFRIDTLGFNKESNSFVIIEYKRDKNF